MLTKKQCKQKLNSLHKQRIDLQAKGVSGSAIDKIRMEIINITELKKAL